MKQWNRIYKYEGKTYKYYDVLKPHEDMSKILKILRKCAAKNVLDLGCGSGRHIIFLVKHDFRVFGIDIAEEGIKTAKKWLKESKLEADLKVDSVYKKFPYKDNFFDAVICVQVLQHGRVNEIKRVIAEMKRVLKPDGIIFVTLSGRYSQGRIRYCLVKTAKKIAPRTYVPTIGNEAGLPHFIHNKNIIKKHFQDFKILDLWKDSRDYYCLLAKNKKF